MKKNIKRLQVQILVYIVLCTCVSGCLGMQGQTHTHITLCNLVTIDLYICPLQWMCLGLQGRTHITSNNYICIMATDKIKITASGL